MSSENVVFDTLIDNAALRVTDLRLTESLGVRKIQHDSALLVGMEDGTGYAAAHDGASRRYLPIARGRVDWLGRGTLEVHAGRGAFGRAVLVEVRALPDPGGVPRTFGDRTIFQTDGVCVYEEIIGPSHVRRLHNHGPRLVLCLSDIDLRNTLPGGERIEVRRQAGAVTWNGGVVTHEVLNVAPEPFWCICVEHP